MNILHIALRELRASFNNTLGWLVLAAWLFLSGMFWATMFSFYLITSADMVSNPYAASQMNFTDYLFAPFFGNVVIVLIFVVPAVSMRLFAEEQKQRTLELLLTSPVSTAEIVLGKFLGAFGFVAIMLAATLYMPGMIEFWGSPDVGAVATGYLGLMLASALILSLGMLLSSMTDNQIVALVFTIVLALMIYILGWVDSDPESFWMRASMLSHMRDFQKGVVNLSDLVYFAGFIGLFLFATHQRVESHRWT